jgi:hypothetical protein
MPPPETITEMIRSCLSGDWNKAHMLGYTLFEEGYTALDIISKKGKVYIHFPNLLSKNYFRYNENPFTSSFISRSHFFRIS